MSFNIQTKSSSCSINLTTKAAEPNVIWKAPYFQSTGKALSMSEQHCQLERFVNEPITCNLLQDENVTKEIKYLKALTSQSAYMRRKGMINDYEIEAFFYLMVTVYSSGIQGVLATLFTSSKQRQKIYSSYKNQLQIFTGNL